MKLETLKDYVQSANIIFLIGSGLSRPFLPTLGNIENQLSQVKDLACEKRRAVVATLFREYFKRAIEPNLNRGEKANGYSGGILPGGGVEELQAGITTAKPYRGVTV